MSDVEKMMSQNQAKQLADMLFAQVSKCVGKLGFEEVQAVLGSKKLSKGMLKLVLDHIGKATDIHITPPVAVPAFTNAQLFKGILPSNGLKTIPPNKSKGCEQLLLFLLVSSDISYADALSKYKQHKLEPASPQLLLSYEKGKTVNNRLRPTATLFLGVDGKPYGMISSSYVEEGEEDSDECIDYFSIAPLENTGNLHPLFHEEDFFVNKKRCLFLAGVRRSLDSTH